LHILSLLSIHIPITLDEMNASKRVYIAGQRAKPRSNCQQAFQIKPSI
jgi:hypothetical protein